MTVIILCVEVKKLKYFKFCIPNESLMIHEISFHEKRESSQKIVKTLCLIALQSCMFQADFLLLDTANLAFYTKAAVEKAPRIPMLLTLGDKSSFIVTNP